LGGEPLRRLMIPFGQLPNPAASHPILERGNSEFGLSAPQRDWSDANRRRCGLAFLRGFWAVNKYIKKKLFRFPALNAYPFVFISFDISQNFLSITFNASVPLDETRGNIWVIEPGG